MNRYILLLLICGFWSCGDFLEPKSKSEFIPKDANSLNELLLGEAYPLCSSGMLNRFLAFLDDDVTCAPFQEAKVGQDRTIWFAAYTWQSDLYYRFREGGLGREDYDIYKGHYSKILGANAVLDYLEGTIGSDAEKSVVKAQALALRSFYYFNLVNLFAQPYYQGKNTLGIPLKLNSEIEGHPLPRNSVEEVYRQIVADLKEAEQLYLTLPEIQQWQANYRTSLPMVQLLLSRVYLYMEQWEAALSYANKVINNPRFSLIDLNDVEANNRNYYFMHSLACTEMIWLYGNVADAVGMVSEMGKEDPDTYTSHSMFQASSSLLACFDRSKGDLRQERYIVNERYASYDEEYNKYYLPQPFGKIKVSSENRPVSGSDFARSFRFSEAYLNAIEASAMLYAQSGDANMRAKALTLLNQFRRYRVNSELYTDLTISDKEKLIIYIRDERRRELCFEDHRWFDLRRWGMEEIQHEWIPEKGTKIIYTLHKNDLGYVLPFPPEALELNKELRQNSLAPLRVD